MRRVTGGAGGAFRRAVLAGALLGSTGAGVVPLEAQARADSARLRPEAARADSVRRPVRLPELRVAVRRALEASTAYVIERSAANLSGSSVSEWVRGLPGVQTRGRGAGGTETMTIRGGRARDVRVTLDGIPLDDPLTGEADLSLVPAASIERATLTAGGGHAGGAGGTSGTLALESREIEPGLRVGALAGSHGRRATEIEAGWWTGGARLGLYARAEGARNDYTFRNRIHPELPTERRINADREAWHLVGRARATGLPLAVLGRVDHVERGTPGRMGNHVWNDARWRERRTTLGASWGETGRATASVSWARRASLFRDGSAGRSERVVADQLTVRGALRVLGGIRIGWEGARGGIGGDPFDEAHIRWTGAIRAERPVALTHDLRLDAALVADAAREGVGISPSLGVTWTPTGDWRAWGRVARARRLPTFADLFLRPGTGARANPDLRPERVELDAELGLAWSLDAIELRSTAFWRRTTDPIVWLPSVVAIWSPSNLGRLTATGLELYGRWEADRWLRVEAAATWQRSRVRLGDEAENPLPYEPALSGSLAMVASSPVRGVRLSLDWVGRRRTNLFAPHDLAPYALLNIRGRHAFYVVGVSAEIELGVINALASTYERIELFPEPGRRFELSLRVRPGRAGLPRTAARDTVGEHAHLETDESNREDN